MPTRRGSGTANSAGEIILPVSTEGEVVGALGLRRIGVLHAVDWRLAAVADDMVCFLAPQGCLMRLGQRMGGVLRAVLAHPLTRGMDIDDPQTSELRRQIILSKPFLKAIYEDWYADVIRFIPPGEGRILELGSGPGFLKVRLPEVMTSDILRGRGIDLVLDGLHLPFRDGCLRGIVMTNVLHHLREPRRFLLAASRCVRRGGWWRWLNRGCHAGRGWCTPSIMSPSFPMLLVGRWLRVGRSRQPTALWRGSSLSGTVPTSSMSFRNGISSLSGGGYPSAI